MNQSAISRNLKKRTSVRVYKRKSAPKYISEDQQKRAKSNCTKKFLPTVNSFWTMRNISHLGVMFLEITDIIHLILHQHQEISSLFRNKSSSHIYWYGLLSLHEGFPIPTFIVQRLLYVKKFI